MNTMISQLRRSFAVQVAIFAMLMPGLVMFPLNISANPTGGVVVNGNVTFSGGAGTLNINQGSNLAIIDWQDFSIGAGELTQFNQPGVNSVALNRVVSGNVSSIQGMLQANGGVIVINPNGIVISSAGVIDVGGMLTLSTLEMSNDDFLNGGANRFQGTTGAGIVNYGAITSRGGDVVMLGNFLQNAGSVKAPDGVVAFGAGGDIIVGQAGGAKISVQAGGVGGATGIDNTGTISGAATELKAHGNVYALAIKNDGLVRASGYNFTGGKLTLNAGPGGSAVNTGQLYAQNRDGSGGQISVSGQTVDIESGTVNASGGNRGVGGSIDISGDVVNIGQDATIAADGQSGGDVTVTGGSSLNVAGMVDAAGDYGTGGQVDLSAAGDVTVAATSAVDVSGLLDAGRARIGGGFQGKSTDIQNAANTTVESGALILADSGQIGNGGEVIVWSDGDTFFGGEISATAGAVTGDGGFVEVSGRNALAYRGVVSTLATNGRTGTLLLDPTNVTITNGGITGTPNGGTISEDDVNLALTQNHLIIHTGGDGMEAGDITIDPLVRIEWGNPNSAFGDIDGIDGADTVDGRQNTHDFTLLATGDINVRGHIISHGLGNVNLFAGWDGETGFPGGDAAIPDTNRADALGPINFSDLAQFGTASANGTVRINDAINNQAVQVGSRFGETNIVAGDLELIVPALGNDQFAHLGYRATTNAESGGAGEYGLQNSSAFRQGAVVDTGTGAVIPIDLAGTDLGMEVANSDTSGDINVSLQGDLFMIGETVNDSRKYTQIGHGGNANVRDLDPSTPNDNGAGTANEVEFSLINADHSGDITVNVGLGGTGQVRMVAGRETGYSMIGHGGLSNPTPSSTQARAFTGGGFTYVNDDPLDLTVYEGGEAAYQAAYDQNFAVTGNNNQAVNDGNRAAVAYAKGESAPTIASNGQRLILSTARGAGAYSGDVTVINNGTGNITATGNPIPGGWAGFVQIGHGGARTARLANTIEGYATGVPEVLNDHNFVNTDTRSTLNLDTTLGPRAFDPDLETVDGNRVGYRGDIDVQATDGNIIFQSGESSRSYAMIGHGGYETPGNVGMFNADGSVAELANINVVASGLIRFSAPIDNDSGRFVRIGHGGYLSPGNAAGNINVEAGRSIEFTAGAGDSSAQIGHGGLVQTWTAGTNTTSTQFVDSDRDDSEGIAGTQHGSITVEADRDITFRSGVGYVDRPFSMIGHGGYGVVALSLATDPLLNGHNGAISVTAGGAIDFMSGQPDAVGTSQDVGMTAANSAFSMIGHGGKESRGDHYGSISVEGGSIKFEAIGGFTVNSASFANAETRGVDNFVMIGHGGYENDFTNNDVHGGRVSDSLGGVTGSDRDSPITVTATDGDITFLAPQLATTAAQFQAFQDFVAGGVGRYADGDIFTEYAVRGHANIGHGGSGGGSYNGTDENGGINGDITVIANSGAISFVGSDFQQEFSTDTSLPFVFGQENIDGNRFRDTFSSRRSEQNFTQIGHGGYNQRGQKSGDIVVNAGLDISLTGGMGRHGHIMIGHGGWDSDASLTGGREGYEAVQAQGSITVTTTGGGIELAAGNGDNGDEIADFAFALIGHGGRSSNGTIDEGSDIVVRAEGGSIQVLGGKGYEGLWAKIGHGGRDSRAEFWHGDIEVYARDNINLETWEGAYETEDNFVQIGHGGQDTDFQFNGDFEGSWAQGEEAPTGDVGSAFGTAVYGTIDVTAATGDITVIAGKDNLSEHSGGAANFFTEGAGIPNSGWQGDAANPAVTGPDRFATGDYLAPSDGYVYASRGNLSGSANGNDPERPNDGTDGNTTPDGDDNIQPAGGWIRIGHGGQNTKVRSENNDISVTSGGDFTATASEFDDGYFAIGSGALDGWSGNDNTGTLRTRRYNQISTGDIDLTVGGDLSLTAGNGNNASIKVGHGAYRTVNRDSNEEINAANPTIYEGDITVLVGGDATLTGGTIDTQASAENYNRVLIGHRDTNSNRTGNSNVTSNVGDTIIAVSRNNPDFVGGGTGTLTTVVNDLNPNGVVFSSALNGRIGELRLYMPNRPQNQIATGTILNGSVYDQPGNDVVALERNDFRGDENLDFFGTAFDGSSPPSSEFVADGDYAVVNGLAGFYQIFMNNTDALVGVEVAPSDAVGDVFVQFDFFSFFFDDLFEAFERGENLFDFDGFEDGLEVSVSTEESREEGVPSRSLVEILLDGSLGDGESFDSDSEEDEEAERIRERAGRKVGSSGLVFYTFDPGTNRYSSFRVFGSRP